MLILGIETACDDSAAAIVQNGHLILSNIVWGQKEVHKRFGGVVPELAARRHTEVITHVIQESLDQAGITFQDIDAIAVNSMRGLIRSIVVGVSSAKAIAYTLNKPLIGVHHIEGHIYSTILQYPDMPFPFVCLTVSGGHNMIILVEDHGKYQVLGQTHDDAAGEAFDKIAKLLSLEYPGGPIIDKIAKQGNPKAFDFPRPMIHRSDYDFSFSGLKTAVMQTVDKSQKQNISIHIPDLLASFQQAVIDVLVSKTVRAANDTGVSAIAVAGGVSANSLLRTTFTQVANTIQKAVFFPDISLCTDNGAMIAALGYYRFRSGFTSQMTLDAQSNKPLESWSVLPS